MKKIIGWFCLVAFCMLVILGSNAKGQKRRSRNGGTGRVTKESGPTLKETLKWLEINARDQIHIGPFANPTYKLILFSPYDFRSCIIRLAINIEDHVNGEVNKDSSFIKEYRLNLASIDPERVVPYKHDEGYWMIPLVSRYEDIQSAQFESGRPTPDKFNYTDSEREVHLPNDNPEFVPRIVKAFQHAIRLCGGKKEPF